MFLLSSALFTSTPPLPSRAFRSASDFMIVLFLAVVFVRPRPAVSRHILADPEKNSETSTAITIPF